MILNNKRYAVYLRNGKLKRIVKTFNNYNDAVTYCEKLKQSIK